MKRLLALAAILASPTLAHADFIGNRQSWDGMSSPSRGAYIAGVMDEMTALFADDTSEERAIKQGRRRCLAEEKIDTASLAKLVDEGYAANASLFTLPPRIVATNQISKVCRRYISEERVKLGLSPLP